MAIKMKGVGAYILPNKIYNEEIDEHFEQRGLSAHSLMKHLGRRKRYFISEGETAITMCSDAMDDCFEKSGLHPEDIEILQYYIPFDEEQHLSKAIKSNVTFWNKKDPAILYRWDDQTHGSGISFPDCGKVKNLASVDYEHIYLYAQWERIQ